MSRAETDHEAQERHALEAFGLRPSSARICPRVVAGKRCMEGHEKRCVCYGLYSRLLDHGRIWLNRDGRHVLTGEPYNADGAELADFIAAMTDLGLDVRLSGRSPWNPGYTLLIIVTRKPDTQEVTTP